MDYLHPVMQQVLRAQIPPIATPACAQASGPDLTEDERERIDTDHMRYRERIRERMELDAQIRNQAQPGASLW